ncbi:glycosyltransferase family 2 protein [Qipengyuania gelatinilytica]|uniref:glycosyltransferase family 2 protein n=1 Tax=Qipengyuania gelatinilytica TaxID=2867231 RepID=UPI001FFD8EC7|nr:glycosyltransferase [Qipengyuania gelatinilytica]
MKPEVSIIVPHYDDLQNLSACLDALERQSLNDGKTFEVIVADNCSPIAEHEILEVIAGRGRLVRVEERGAGPARNGGAKLAQGEVLAFTDSDCIPDAAWLQQGVAALANCDVVGGRMEVLVGSEKSKSGAEAFEQVFAFDNEKYVHSHGFTVTANLFCRAATFWDVGAFRTGVSEDVEWCRRATSKGYKLAYCQGALVGHPARRNWDELVRKWRRLDEESFALHRDEGKSGLRWLLRAGMVAFSIFPHAFKLAIAPELRGFGERARAFATLVAIRLWRAIHYVRLAILPKS